jgi:hypothetical protein
VFVDFSLDDPCRGDWLPIVGEGVFDDNRFERVHPAFRPAAVDFLDGLLSLLEEWDRSWIGPNVPATPTRIGLLLDALQKKAPLASPMSVSLLAGVSSDGPISAKTIKNIE